MPLLPDIKSGAQFHGDPKDQIDALVKQLNEWGRAISNENITRVIKSDQSTEAMKLGDLGDDGFGISFSDGDITFLTITRAGLTLNDGTNDRFFLGDDEA